MFWVALSLIILGAMVVVINLYLLAKSGLRLWRDESSIGQPSRITLVGSILAILGALLSKNTSLAWASFAVVALDPDGPIWLPVWLAWRHVKQKDKRAKNVV